MSLPFHQEDRQLNLKPPNSPHPQLQGLSQLHVSQRPNTSHGDGVGGRISVQTSSHWDVPLQSHTMPPPGQFQEEAKRQEGSVMHFTMINPQRHRSGWRGTESRSGGMNARWAGHTEDRSTWNGSFIWRHRKHKPRKLANNLLLWPTWSLPWGHRHRACLDGWVRRQEGPERDNTEKNQPINILKYCLSNIVMIQITWMTIEQTLTTTIGISEPAFICTNVLAPVFYCSLTPTYMLCAMHCARHQEYSKKGGQRTHIQGVDIPVT